MGSSMESIVGLIGGIVDGALGLIERKNENVNGNVTNE